MGLRLRQAGEDLRELAVVEAQVAFEDCGEDHTVVGGDREVTALIELRRREAGPVAVDTAAADAAAQDPSYIPVAVLGAAIAVLSDPATELGENDDDGVVPGVAETSGKGEEPLAERSQPVGELTLGLALFHVSVPAAEAQKHQPDVPVLANEVGEPCRLSRKSGRRGGTVVGAPHLAREPANQLGPCSPPLPVSLAYRVFTGVEPVEGTADFRLVDRHRPRPLWAQRQIGDRLVAGQDLRQGWADGDRIGRSVRLG